MSIKEIKRGDRLQVALIELEIGDAVKVPYKHYSLNSIRATASQLKADRNLQYDVNARSNVAAVITRTQ